MGATSLPEQAANAVKPRLRGWIHAGTFPISVVASIVLVVNSPTTTAKVTTAIFGLSAAMLFGISAVYHRGTWSPRTTAVLRRLDHSNIFFIIAGTYTPLAAILLPTGTAKILLWTVWIGAIAGLLARVFFLNAPRWAYTPLYVLLGLAAVGYLPQFSRADAGGPEIVWLIVGCGVAYIFGAVVYATKWPNPSPRWFGFHEVFHVATVVGYWCTYVAVSIASYRSA